MASERDELLEIAKLAKESGDNDLALRALEKIETLPFDQPQQLSAMESLGGAIGQVNQGLTFGMADEMAGGMNAVNPMAMGEGYFDQMGDRYTQGRDEARGLQSKFSQENPNIALPLEAAGAMATGAAAAPKLMGMMGMDAIPALSTQGMLKGAQLGALEGSGYGYGTAEGDAWDTATNMAGYGAGGALLNPAMDATLAGAAGLFGAAKNKWNQTASNKSAELLANRLEAEGLTASDAFEQMQSLGPEGMLADVGDLKSAADVLMLNKGAAAKRAEGVLESRQMGQQDRIMGDTAGILNVKPSEFRGTVKQMSRSRSDTAKPLYEAAYAAPVSVTPALAKIFERPSVKAAMKNTKKIADEEGLDIGDIDWTSPTMQQLDTLKKSLDKQIGIKKRSGNDDWRRINKTKNDLLNEIDIQNSDYKLARNTWESDTKTMEAADYGRDIFKNNAEEAAEIVGYMTPTERDSYVMGAVKAVEDMVQKTGDTHNAMKKLVGNPALRKKLRTAFESDDQFDDFMKVMDREATFSGTRQGIGKGSQTASRQETLKSMGISAEGEGILDMAAQGLTQGTAGKVSLIGKLFPKRGMLDPEVGEQVGNILTKQGLTEEELMKMISDRQKRSMSARLTPSFGAVMGPSALSGF